MKKLFTIAACIMLVLSAGCSEKESLGIGDQSASTMSGTAQPSTLSTVQTTPGTELPPFDTEQPTLTQPADTPPVKNKAAQSDVVELEEDMFIAQLNDIYLNSDEYLGKTIKYEGMFTWWYLDETNMPYYLVYRDSPGGCCGTDGKAAFEVVWPDGSDKAYPNENDWCEVIGTLGSYEEDGYSYLHIILDSLTVKSERGAEYVSR